MKLIFAMSVLNCTGLAWKYRWHWNKKLLSLLGSVPLKVLEMQALIFCELVLGPEIWLELRVLVSWPMYLANYSLVLLLWWGLDYEQVEEVGNRPLLVIKLVIGLVVGASFQLESLSVGMILGPDTGKAVWPNWIVLDRDLRDEWPLWWIHLEHCRVFRK